MDTKISKIKGHRYNVLVLLSHADDPTTAHLHSSILDMLQCLDTIRIRMSRTNVCVVFLTCVQVVIHPVDPASFQAIRLLLGQQTQTGTNIEPILVFDLGNNLLHRIEFAFVGTACRNHKTVRLGTTLGCDPGRLHQIIPLQDVVLGYGRIRNFGLTAVVTILRTQPTLGTHQEVQLHRLAKMLMPDSKTRRQNRQNICIRSFQD